MKPATSPAKRLALGMIAWAALVGRPSAAADPVYYGGIEIGGKGVKMVAIPIDESGTPILADKLEVGTARPGEAQGKGKAAVVNVTLSALEPDGRFQQAAIEDAAAAVADFHARLSGGKFKVQPERLWVVASSGLTAKGRPPNFEDLRKAVFDATGGEERLLEIDQREEVELLIRGTIPAREIADTILLDIGSSNSKLGYFTPAAGINDAQFLVPGLPIDGTMAFTRTIQAGLARAGKKGFREFAEAAAGLRPAIENTVESFVDRKPGLINRPKVALVGGTPWVISVLTNPEGMFDEDIHCKFRLDRLKDLHDRLRSTGRIPLPDLGRVPAALRARAEAEVRSASETFSPEQLLAGTELVLAFASALRWEEHQKEVSFMKSGVVAWIVAFVEKEKNRSARAAK